jgi:tRNA1(Val) A37 N6-methylase TrmN6
LGIEAQAMSASLARRSIAWNGVGDRVVVKSGDLRDEALLAEEAAFDLVTGTPPYFPCGEGIESERPQCGPCRFEHRGGVEAYASAAARVLAVDGCFVMCAASMEADRVAAGARDAGLVLTEMVDVVPRAGKPPLVSVFTMRPLGGGETIDRSCARNELVVRDRAGAWTPAFAAVRTAMGLPPTPPGNREISRGAALR